MLLVAIYSVCESPSPQYQYKVLWGKLQIQHGPAAGVASGQAVLLRNLSLGFSAWKADPPQAMELIPQLHLFKSSLALITLQQFETPAQ